MKKIAFLCFALFLFIFTACEEKYPEGKNVSTEVLNSPSSFGFVDVTENSFIEENVDCGTGLGNPSYEQALVRVSAFAQVEVWKDTKVYVNYDEKVMFISYDGYYANDIEPIYSSIEYTTRDNSHTYEISNALICKGGRIHVFTVFVPATPAGSVRVKLIEGNHPYNYSKDDTGENSSSDNGSGEGNKDGDNSYPNNVYNIYETTCFKLYMLDDKDTGTWEVVTSYYAWESKSTGSIVLSKSTFDDSRWIGSASKNNGKKIGVYDISGYKYKYIDYTPVGGAWYYYFNLGKKLN